MDEKKIASTNDIHRDIGKFEHGCEHYRRRCKIRAPCCNRIFTCRHCHNEFTNSLSDPKDRHEIVRHDIKQVICLICDTEQEVAQNCTNCGVTMGEYFCDICNFYDDDTSKKQFHCVRCGICRVGGRDNFFHCEKCGICYEMKSRDDHLCIENSMKNYCPVCYEYLFDSTKRAMGMKCGHTIHSHCLSEMAKQNQYRCPICSKTVMDMSSAWEMLDMEIGAVQMPDEYQYEVSILCNDCNNTSTSPFHIFGLKCRHCKSYNTRRISSSDDNSNVGASDSSPQMS